MEESNGYGNAKHKNFIASILDRTPGKSRSHPWISNPQDFRQVSDSPSDVFLRFLCSPSFLYSICSLTMNGSDCFPNCR